MTDLDPLLRETLARVGPPTDARPSLADVHRRARRHSRRRLAVAAGGLACAGLVATALVVRTDSPVSNGAGPSQLPSSTSSAPESTTSGPMQRGPVTTLYPLPTSTITPALAWYAMWNARHDPAGLAIAFEPPDQAAAGVMPSPEDFDCVTDPCRALFNYVEWHEIARLLGFHDVSEMQAANPTIDFSLPPHEGDDLQSGDGTEPSPETSPVQEVPTSTSIV